MTPASTSGARRTSSCPSRPGCVVALWRSSPAATWVTCSGVFWLLIQLHVLISLVRRRSPYTWSNQTDVSVVRRNSARLAEVWMDEYKVRQGMTLSAHIYSISPHTGAVLSEDRAGARLGHRRYLRPRLSARRPELLLLLLVSGHRVPGAPRPSQVPGGGGDQEPMVQPLR